MRALQGCNWTKLEISLNLWAGFGLICGGAGTALVADGATVAEWIDEYRRVGISTFIFSGCPRLEEAYSFGDRVLPRLAADHDDPRAAGAPTDFRLVGDAIANTSIPEERAASAS